MIRFAEYNEGHELARPLLVNILTPEGVKTISSGVKAEEQAKDFRVSQSSDPLSPSLASA
jgi:hypothetical protein